MSGIFIYLSFGLCLTKVSYILSYRNKIILYYLQNVFFQTPDANFIQQ